MKIAIIFRAEYNKDNEYSIFGLPKYFKEIFEELDIMIIPILSQNNLEEICKMCDALILPGSAINIPPKYYGKKPIKGINYDIDEYKLDELAIKTFYRYNKPILGICGGHQSINVCFGGTLNQKIANHELNGGVHKISIKDNTFISSIYGNSSEVNSYHIQSIDKVAPGFTSSAISEDETIEAIEKGNIIGVQWHPEKVKDMKFFKAFISEKIKKPY